MEYSFLGLVSCRSSFVCLNLNFIVGLLSDQMTIQIAVCFKFLFAWHLFLAPSVEFICFCFLLWCQSFERVSRLDLSVERILIVNP